MLLEISDKLLAVHISFVMRHDDQTNTLYSIVLVKPAVIANNFVCTFDLCAFGFTILVICRHRLHDNRSTLAC
jgi:hypothetical protein